MIFSTAQGDAFVTILASEATLDTVDELKETLDGLGMCKVIDENTLKMRVWERGSGETWACGTGACAAVVAAVLNGFCAKDKDITVLLRGGTLKIRYTDEAVYLTGDAVTVFSGKTVI